VAALVDSAVVRVDRVAKAAPVDSVDRVAVGASVATTATRPLPFDVN